MEANCRPRPLMYYKETKIQKNKLATYLQAEILGKGEGLQVSSEDARSPARLGSTLEAFSGTLTVATIGTVIISLAEGGSLGAFIASSAGGSSPT